MYFWERTGMIEADSSEALRKACPYELKTESTKGKPTAPHVTTGGLCRWKAINKVGRHVGLDFYDLLIEGDYAHCSNADPLLPRTNYTIEAVYLILGGPYG
jgi:hypothetical protein